jgi:TPR repeat protein
VDENLLRSRLDQEGLRSLARCLGVVPIQADGIPADPVPGLTGRAYECFAQGDVHEGINLCEKAAEQGSSGAMSALASLFAESDGAQALVWARRSAEQAIRGEWPWLGFS